MITVEGVVLKERSVGEQDKFIDILTKEDGVIELCVKGAKKINGKSSSSVQLFAYSRFCIQQRKERFYLNSAEPIHIFYGLRESLTRLSLASYFADVLRNCIEQQAQQGDVMRLFLNSLHYLEKNLRSEKLLKSIFEFRLMSEIGFMPDILACQICGAFEPHESFFNINGGIFYCSDCFAENRSSFESENYLKINLSVLNAVRHIVLADFDRLFNFRVSESIQQKLSIISENYLTAHLERSFGTLDFYKSLNNI